MMTWLRPSRTERRAKGSIVQAGDRVYVDDTGPSMLTANPQLALTVLYEDDELIAVDKPPGVPSHALRANETNTVANFLLARFPEFRLADGAR